MSETLVMVLAGGASRALPVLTAHRATAALPYGGRYRVIDFCLSNCSNSGLYHVGVLAQYNPASLIAHVGNGQAWDINRRKGGVMILQPYVGKTESNWFRGTADALYQHIQVIKDTPCEDILLLSADQVYRMDYGSILAFHRTSGSHVTLAVKPSSYFVAGRYGCLELDGQGRVRSFVEKPEEDNLPFCSLGIYVFDKDVLIERLSVASEGGHDIVFDVLVPLVKEGRASGFVFDGYWADVGWLQAYYDSSMLLVERPSAFDLNDPAWPVFTPTRIRPPTIVRSSGQVRSSVVANGCVIEGQVLRSVLFPGTRVCQGARVEDSIVFSDSTISKGATVRSSILDKLVRIGAEASVGFGPQTCSNSLYPDLVNTGITTVGKRTSIPDGTRIGKNCLIGPDLGAEAIPHRDIVCGETILGEEKWQKIWS